LRRAGFYCQSLMLWMQCYDGGFADSISLPQVNDDQAILAGLKILWERAERRLNSRTKVLRVGVTLGELTPPNHNQLAFLLNDVPERQQWERLGLAIDQLHIQYGKAVDSIGFWQPPNGGNVGGKIPFTPIPSGEDFW